MVDLAVLLQQHIYLALAVGGLLEGETVLILAGFAAHQGHASWWGITLFAALINALVDMAWFLVGRWRGPALVARFPSLARRIADLEPRLQAHRRWLVFAVRFSYGLRVAGPVALGMARVPVAEFALLNPPAALLWSAVFTGLGYAFGLAMLQMFERFGRYEAYVVGGLLVAGALVWAARRARR